MASSEPNETIRDAGASHLRERLVTLRETDALGAAEVGSLWSAIAKETVSEERMLKHRLRDLPTRWRVTLAEAGAFLVATAALHFLTSKF